jgi:hypothetical protein
MRQESCCRCGRCEDRQRQSCYRTGSSSSSSQESVTGEADAKTTDDKAVAALAPVLLAAKPANDKAVAGLTEDDTAIDAVADDKTASDKAVDALVDARPPMTKSLSAWLQSCQGNRQQSSFHLGRCQYREQVVLQKGDAILGGAQNPVSDSTPNACIPFRNTVTLALLDAFYRSSAFVIVITTGVECS